MNGAWTALCRGRGQGRGSRIKEEQVMMTRRMAVTCACWLARLLTLSVWHTLTRLDDNGDGSSSGSNSSSSSVSPACSGTRRLTHDSRLAKAKLVEFSRALNTHTQPPQSGTVPVAIRHLELTRAGRRRLDGSTLTRRSHRECLSLGSFYWIFVFFQVTVTRITNS